MRDKTFEWSLTGLTVVVVLWMVLGIWQGIMGWFPAVLIGIVVEIVGGGALLYYWGKSYMAKE